MLVIRLLGPFEVRVNGAPLPRVRSRKGRWLLALLALRAGREVERGWLVGMLWPDSPDAAGLANLRCTLKDLRRAMGPAASLLRSSTPHTLSLDLSGADIDVAAFDAAIAQAFRDGDLASGSTSGCAALERAVSLYQGPLLEGCAEPWAFEERRFREQAYLGALECLADQAQAAGTIETAERHLRRVVAVDSLRESAQRALMHLLATDGSYAAALLIYRELRRRLHHDLAAEPDPETQALFAQIRDAARRRSRRGVPAGVAHAPTSRPGQQSAASERSALLHERGAQPDERMPELSELEALRPSPSAAVALAEDSGTPAVSEECALPFSGQVTPAILSAAPLGPQIGPSVADIAAGPLPLCSAYYVERSADAVFRTAVARHESIVLVKGARQMGKTSLLARGLQQARDAGDRVVVTDLQRLDAAHLESPETLYVTLAGWIADQLELDAFLDQVWSPRLGPGGNFERYLRRELLAQPVPLVWGLDEVDVLASCPFGGGVFALFRSFYGARSLDPNGPWHRLTMALAYATEPHLFIQDLNQSPFNVGRRVTLDDFSLAEVAELNRRYDRPLRDDGEVARYARLVGGHPYLAHRGVEEMAEQEIRLADFEPRVDADDGLFGDHLKRLLVLLVETPELREEVEEVLQGRPCRSASHFFRLRSAGILAGSAARDARLRCPLYSAYLERHLL
jgi:DNA-binding SARP family transcriptional activator